MERHVKKHMHIFKASNYSRWEILKIHYPAYTVWHKNKSCNKFRNKCRKLHLFCWLWIRNQEPLPCSLHINQDTPGPCFLSASAEGRWPMNLNLSGLLVSQGGIAYWKDAYLTAGPHSQMSTGRRTGSARLLTGNLGYNIIYQEMEDPKSNEATWFMYLILNMFSCYCV